MDPKEARRNDRYTQLAVAARLALKDASLEDTSKLDADRFGVNRLRNWRYAYDSDTESRFMMEARKVSPFMIPSLIANIASGVVAIEVVHADQTTE